MRDVREDSIDLLKDQVVYLRSRLNQLRTSRRVLMALLETVESERRNTIIKLEEENRRLRREQKRERYKQSLYKNDGGKVLWLCRNEEKIDE
ncbi:translation initiation factor 2 [Heliorestis acidaminivorans]|uniref:Translation initiation factor 2 n=1 Tax=Heliorestis acidaminivorans TaxID=553427 RepID=A0A6I0F5R8_9FIRM|nr:translation initiation factor 2 [Heliorestis acidaminivorans]KAB2954177.1 translation initiation factor 2 [Heliorestis acidaminivorans]